MNKEDAPGEFIGMLKLSKQGAELFNKFYELSKVVYANRPFHRAPNLKKAYITDMLQELVDNSIPVHCVKIQNGWKELDTQEDFNNATKSIKDMIL